jgi:hypothetical protein
LNTYLTHNPYFLILWNLSVLAYTEIPEDQEIRVVGKVGIQANHAQEVAA